MYRKILLVLLGFLVSGCTQIEEIFLSPHEKFNKAFPPNSEVRIATENMRALLENDKAALKAFDEQYSSRSQIRALTCLQNSSVGRFDSVSSVKKLPVSKDCLEGQDAQLQQYVGLRMIGILITKEPVRPLKPLGPPVFIPTPSGGPEVYIGIGAAKANIAVLQGTRGELTTIEIPSGKKVASLPVISERSVGFTLSPNGRVVVIPTSNTGLFFLDSETGLKIWETKGFNGFHAWLPKQEAAIVRAAKSGDLMLLDLKNGSTLPHPVGLRDHNYGLLVDENSGQVLLGAYKKFALLKHARGAGGLEASIVKEFQLTNGSGVTSRPPVLMQNAKAIVFVSSTDLMKLDLESNEETFWKTSGVLGGGGQFGKLSETSLLVDLVEPGDWRTKPWVLDIEKLTIAPVEGSKAEGIINEFPGRAGFIRRTSGGVWTGDEVATGQPVPFDTMLSEANLKRELAQLEAQVRAQERAAQMQTMQSAPTAPAPSTPAWTQTINKPMLNLPPETVVEAIGVYQGAGNKSPDGSRKTANVEVRVRRTANPVVLVLSSYEPVRWILRPEPGARLVAVLHSGYHSSEVVGAGSARVVVAGSSYAYKREGPGFGALNQQTMKWTGKPIGSFQGKYEGEVFIAGS